MGTSGLSRLLVGAGRISEQEGRTIARESGNSPYAFAKSVLALGIMNDQQLANFIAQKTKHPLARIEPEQDSFQDLLSRLDGNLLHSLEIVPLSLEENQLSVAMLDPLDEEVLQQITFFTGYRLKPYVTTSDKIQKTLTSRFPHFSPSLTDFQILMKKFGIGKKAKTDSSKAKGAVNLYHGNLSLHDSRSQKESSSQENSFNLSSQEDFAIEDDILIDLEAHSPIGLETDLFSTDDLAADIDQDIDSFAVTADSVSIKLADDQDSENEVSHKSKTLDPNLPLDDTLAIEDLIDDEPDLNIEDTLEDLSNSIQFGDLSIDETLSLDEEFTLDETPSQDEDLSIQDDPFLSTLDDIVSATTVEDETEALPPPDSEPSLPLSAGVTAPAYEASKDINMGIINHALISLSIETEAKKILAKLANTFYRSGLNYGYLFKIGNSKFYSCLKWENSDVIIDFNRDDNTDLIAYPWFDGLKNLEPSIWHHIETSLPECCDPWTQSVFALRTPDKNNTDLFALLAWPATPSPGAASATARLIQMASLKI
jgi:hypothetical protein